MRDSGERARLVIDAGEKKKESKEAKEAKKQSQKDSHSWSKWAVMEPKESEGAAAHFAEESQLCNCTVHNTVSTNAHGKGPLPKSAAERFGAHSSR